MSDIKAIICMLLVFISLAGCAKAPGAGDDNAAYYKDEYVAPENIADGAETPEHDNSAVVTESWVEPIPLQDTILSDSSANNPPEDDMAYSNPIDAYYLPRIKNASAEVEVRSFQDTYHGVWKSEFANLMKWLDERFVYPDDKTAVAEYAKSVEQLIAATQELKWAAFFTREEREQDQLELGHRGNFYGNGRRSYINQTKAEMYRDAAMRIIDYVEGRTGDKYVFLDIDYSEEHYE